MAVKFLLSWWTPSIHMRKLWRHYENIVHIMLRLNVSIRVVIRALWKNLCFLCPELWAWRNLMLNGEWSATLGGDEGRKVLFLPSFFPSFLPYFLPSLLPPFLPSFLPACLPAFLLAFLTSFFASFLPACLSLCLLALNLFTPFCDIIKSVSYCLDYVHVLYSFQS